MSRNGHNLPSDHPSSGSEPEGSKNQQFMNLRRVVDKFQFCTPSKRPPTATSKTSASSSARRLLPVKASNAQVAITPATTTQAKKSNASDPVEVYCRLRPPLSTDVEICVTVKDAKSLSIFTPESLSWNKAKESIFTFENIYNVLTGQKAIFDEIARPLVEDLLEGKSGLLFAYGVTGSGKTYTMSGTAVEPGIIPRVLDVIFNSVGKHKAPKFSFKSDHMNGFESQSKAETMLQRQAEINRTPTQRTLRSATNGFGVHPSPVVEPESDEEDRLLDTTILPIKNEDCLFSVFVTYVQIYNNLVYDLLDDASYISDFTKKTTCTQAKILREDSAKNIYVHNVTEVEVESAEEALEVFKRGQKRRKLAHTLLNSESSRSHSIFNIRLVQAPLDAEGEEIIDDKNLIHVGQLSLVDLAGSERYTRTQATGERLKEAGQINSSLMQLRMCMDFLRKKQKGVQFEEGLAPYRSNKLTYFLKSFFEGEGRVRMILCINPRTQDYEENLHVMEFAELTKEIQISRPQPVRMDPMTPGRRKANTMLKEIRKILVDENVVPDTDMPFGTIFDLGPPLPITKIVKAEEGELLLKLRRALEARIKGRSNLHSVILDKRTEFRHHLILLERELEATKAENLNFNFKSAELLEENKRMESSIVQLQFEKNEIEVEKESLEKKNLDLTQQVDQWREDIRMLELAHQEERKRLTTDNELQRELDGMKRERQMFQEEAKLKAEYKEKDKTIAAMKKLVSQVDTGLSRPSRSRTRESKMSFESSMSSGTDIEMLQSPPRSRVRSEPRLPLTSPIAQKINFAISNGRRSRSQSSTRGTWLEHTPALVGKSNTVFQPVLKKKKSVQKLLSVDDLAKNVSKYVLRTNVQDSEGDVETQLYKADVMPTVTGGAQVVFNDVEILKQVSPTTGNRKRTSNTARQTIADEVDLDELSKRCTMGIGHMDVDPKRLRYDNE